MDQRWTDAVFLHWRIRQSTAAAFMPPGVVPDAFDGSAWVGLIGFRLQGAGLGHGPGIPYLGDFNEINVRLYSRDADGTRGVVFLSLDASRLAVVLAARAAGIPYVWSRTSFLEAGDLEPAGAVQALGLGGLSAAAARRSVGYAVRRFRGGERSAGDGASIGDGASRGGSVFAVTAELTDDATDPLSIHLTARFGLHTRFRGRTLYIPNAHGPWPLFRASLTRLEDQLVAAVGINVTGAPDSVLFSPGVHTQFGRPRVVHHKA
jgi:uncharacterized protein